MKKQAYLETEKAGEADVCRWRVVVTWLVHMWCLKPFASWGLCRIYKCYFYLRVFFCILACHRLLCFSISATLHVTTSVIYIILLESQTWYPQQKLDLAKLKLEGANPVTITTEELKAGFKDSKYLAKFLECVKGHNSVRSQMPSYRLLPEEQV